MLFKVCWWNNLCYACFTVQRRLAEAKCLPYVPGSQLTRDMIEIIQSDFIVAANVFILSLLVTLTIKCQATNAGYFDLHLVNNKGRTLLYNNNRVSIEK